MKRASIMICSLLCLLTLLLVACQAEEGEASVTPPIANRQATATQPAALATVAQTQETMQVVTEEAVAPPQVEAGAESEAVPATETVPPTAPSEAVPEEAPVTPTPLGAPVGRVSLAPVAEGFARLTYLTHAFDERLFVVEQQGVIYIIRNGERLPTPFLDISDRVNDSASEQGLLSVAFHPDYAQNGFFFVNYTDNSGGDTVISRFQVSANPDQADPASEQMLLTISQPYGNHNGGQLQFGPDSYLYVGMGDGGSANDPENNGQRPSTLLGALLRLDVDNGNDEIFYAIPPDNPYVDDPDGRNEIWAIGLRNPWRFSFDRDSGDLYIADVGQNQYEEINVAPLAEGGINYGWNIMEGRHCFRSADCDPSGLHLPIAEYEHGLGCSVTGGYVYRGQQQPQLWGNYFFADYCSGRIWSLYRQGEEWVQTVVLEGAGNITSFGEDVAGELYAVTAGGEVYRLQQPATSQLFLSPLVHAPSTP